MKLSINSVALSLAILLLCAMGVLPWKTKSQSGERGQSVQINLPNGQRVDLYAESYALVIGVSRYTNGVRSLPGVKTDVEAVATVLEQHGFKVTKILDPDYQQFDNAMRDFIASKGRLQNARLLIYYAGHGETVRMDDGRKLGYIVPADAPDYKKNQELFLRKAISMDQIEVYAKQVAARHVMFVFDSCFSGILFLNRSTGIPPTIENKLALPVRQFITAGTENQTVPDESIFRRVFVRGLEGEADSNRDSYITGSELGAYLEDQVANYTRRAQTPIYGKILNPDLDRGDMVFVLKKEEATAVRPPISLPGAVRPSRQEPGELQTNIEEIINGIAIRLVRIPSGTFLMGSPSDEAQRHDDEGPQHEVTLSQPFYMGKYEVTQMQWRFVAQLPKVKIDLEPDPSKFKGESLPVEQVSWEEAMEFCERLSKATGKQYRLPTEAEWEYACRAGKKTPFTFGDIISSVIVNFDGAHELYNNATPGAYRSMTVAVGSLGAANAFGLYDMHGNVSEWCLDWYSAGYYSQSPSVDPKGPGIGSIRVIRGGSWWDYAKSVRSAQRNNLIPTEHILEGRGSLGFRVVRIIN